MAKTTIQVITDDFDGTQSAKSHSFSLDGEKFTIDLSGDNYDRLQEALRPFMVVATKVPHGRSRRGEAAMTTRESRAYRAMVRAWAAQNGHEVSDRGMIPLDVQDAFRQSLNQPENTSEAPEA